MDQRVQTYSNGTDLGLAPNRLQPHHTVTVVQPRLEGSARLFVMDTVNVNGLPEFLALAKRAPIAAGLIALPFIESAFAIIVMGITAAAINNDNMAFGWGVPPKRIYIIVVVSDRAFQYLFFI
ncbi:hypothetical protein LEL_09277 [Akanthomyces lecanii RCEF 1005]|uniref:Uncharacterized protein n=1 Tax=Akanthomyces lecanii RCEF 1005 TaxID=1081108 RepID=A0A162JPW5_CORDF|nr:hypothetical protein LEL_09277 [Akanthomyces lecanii RCEF 1005]